MADVQITVRKGEQDYVTADGSDDDIAVFSPGDGASLHIDAERYDDLVPYIDAAKNVRAQNRPD